jgi:tRNA A-37 threonylcarbamoyl transferase component Bud32
LNNERYLKYKIDELRTKLEKKYVKSGFPKQPTKQVYELSRKLDTLIMEYIKGKLV